MDDQDESKVSHFIHNHVTSTQSYSNTTEDIVRAGCFVEPFDEVACTRYGVMAVIIFITGLLCIYRIIRLHCVRHEGSHHYLIFYFSTVVCTLCIVHWILGDYAQLDFAAQWFKQLCYLVVTHFFWTRAYRALRADRLTSICLVPCLAMGFAYCTIIVILGIVKVNDYKNACLAIYWVLMSSAEFFIAQMFLIAAIFISKRLDRISTLRSVRNSQKRKLWGLVVVFEISAIIAFTYDLVMKSLGNEDDGCGKIFHFDQVLYSSVFGTFMIIKFGLPIWVLLAALEPVETRPLSDSEDDTGSYQSSDSVPVLPTQRTVYRPRLFRRAQSDRTTLTTNGILTPVDEEILSSTSPHIPTLVSRVTSTPS